MPTPKKLQASPTSIILQITWFFVLAWLLIILYSWYSGFLHSSKIQSLRYVDTVITNAEHRVRESIQKIHVPQIAPNEDNEIHIIFSTDCTPYQDWQSLSVFYSATIVKQKGTITRIASGCDELKKEELTALYRKLYPQYHVHFTPDFKKDEHSKKSYDFYNKPWGLKHWLEHARPSVHAEAIVALIDPDFLFLRPLTTALAGDPALLHRKALAAELFPRVVEGRPAAQVYGLGAPWANDDHKKFNRTDVCGVGSPCLEPSQQYAAQHYSVGPPYLVHARDMVRLAAAWTLFVPRVYRGYPYLLAEMYAYSMAAAHERLPHFQVEQHMVSNVDAGDEGWPWVDALPRVCAPPDSEGVFHRDRPLPTFVHFCQNYQAGGVGFAKRRVPHDLFSCAGPLFVELPDSLGAEDTNGVLAEAGAQRARNSLVRPRRNAFMVCTVHRVLNAALLDYKRRMCTGGDVNYNYTLNVLGG